MKRILIPLLILVLICASAVSLAEGEEAVTLELKTDKLQVYAADDPFLAELKAGLQPQEGEEPPEGSELPALILSPKKKVQLQVTVGPKGVKNRKVVLSAENEELLQIRGTTVTGLKTGGTVLTIASEQDPTVTVQYLVLVIQPVTRISVTTPQKSVAVGQTVTLTPAFIPEDATLKQVIWSSADERIATVDENGTVTGVKRGSVRIVATAKDSGKIRANFSIQVTQNAEEITLDKAEITVDAGKSAALKATVLPKDTNDKNVIWSSSDESIATVNGSGRITGVALGDCEITCTSKTADGVQAKAVVHVQQPVQKIIFGDAPTIYMNESAQLTWGIEPADASNQKLTFKSGNPGIVTVDENGIITGIKAGDTFVNAVTTDGSNRQARVKVRILQHLTGVHMYRDTAYLDIHEKNITGAVLQPKNFVNLNMFWESADPSVAALEEVPKEPYRIRIIGINPGKTTVTGTTEDGGLRTSILVRVGDWSSMTKITDAYINGKGRVRVTVKNVHDELPVSNIVLEVEAYDSKGKPVAINTKDNTNIVKATYKKSLNPGKQTPEDEWEFEKDFDPEAVFHIMVVRVKEYQINHDWVKVLRQNRQPKFEYNPYKKKK